MLRGGADGGNAEFYQVGAELLGDSSSDADLEVAERCLAALQAAARERRTSFSRRSERSRRCSGPSERRRLAGSGGLDPRAPALRDRPGGGAISDAFAGAAPAGRRLPPDDPLLRRIGGTGATLARVAGLSRSDRVASNRRRRAGAALLLHGFLLLRVRRIGGEPIAGGATTVSMPLSALPARRRIRAGPGRSRRGSA